MACVEVLPSSNVTVTVSVCPSNRSMTGDCESLKTSSGTSPSFVQRPKLVVPSAMPGSSSAETSMVAPMSFARLSLLSPSRMALPTKS